MEARMGDGARAGAGRPGLLELETDTMGNATDEIELE